MNRTCSVVGCAGRSKQWPVIGPGGWWYRVCRLHYERLRRGWQLVRVT